MLIKFGSIITSGSGSLGGHTIQKSTGGVQLRTKPIPKNTPSAAQLLIRSYNSKLQAGWRALTDAQRSTWNNFADTNITLLKNGNRINLSGHSLWMKYNFFYLNEHLPLISSPYSFKTIRLGPELILNGSFVNTSFWSILGQVTISGGKANFSPTTTTYIRQVPPITIGLSYLFSFQASNISIPPFMLFRRFTATPFFDSMINNYHCISSFYYFFSGIISAPFDYLIIFGQPNKGSFSITNVSLKQIL